MVVSLLRWYVQHLPLPLTASSNTHSRNPRYNGRLAARPLLTQSITTAVLFATGDITAQQLVDQRGLDKHDFARTGRMALYGGGEFALSLH